MNLPDLGVGVVFWPGLEPLLESGTDLVNVVEVEPQAFWFESSGRHRSYRVNAAAAERIRALPQPKLVHGVGFPVGGSHRAGREHLVPLLAAVEDLGAPWASEHLSFNTATWNGQEFNTGFLLPPLQTTLGVQAAVDAIRHVTAQLPVPFAVETGVNYLRPRAGELPDGRFVGAVAERADCGILLDLHNLWVNERNGRQTSREYVAQLPLERVFEVHLAGGSELHGFMLDAHSGGIPEELVERATEILPELPNLHALIFEIMPDHIVRLGLSALREQIELLHRLWDGRQARRRRSRPRGAESAATVQEAHTGEPSPQEWEDALGALAVGFARDDALTAELAADPGVPLLQELVREFRAGMVVTGLKLTSRLLMLSLGEERYRSLLREFWAKHPPEPFGSTEALAFAQHVEESHLDVEFLSEVLGFERALILARVDGRAATVCFRHDPAELLTSLAEGHLPAVCPAGEFPLHIAVEEHNDVDANRARA